MILQLSDDTWSRSPEMENSEWLYEGSEILNYGSPREENAFKLSNIRYSDDWFSNIEIDTDSTHIIYGDYYNFYKAQNDFLWCYKKKKQSLMGKLLRQRLYKLSL